MLARDILTKKFVIGASLIIASLIYSGGKKWHYSNCTLKDFEFVDIISKDTLLIKKRFKRGKQVLYTNIEVKFAGAHLPSPSKNNNCRNDAYQVTKSEFLRVIGNGKFILSDCRPKTLKTNGKIIMEDGKDFSKYLIANNFAPRNWLFRIGKINWCKYKTI